MYTIKEVSKKMNISPHTLRFYDNEGLFPCVERNEKNVRVFSDNDLKWVETVQCLRNTGLSLADIKKYIALCKDGDSTVKERYEIILSQKKKAEEEIENMQKRLSILEEKVDHYKAVLNNEKEDFCNPFKK